MEQPEEPTATDDRGGGPRRQPAARNALAEHSKALGFARRTANRSRAVATTT